MMANTSQEKVLLLHTGITILLVQLKVATGSMNITLIEVFGGTMLTLAILESGLTKEEQVKELGLLTSMIHLSSMIQLLVQTHQVP